MTNEYLGIPLWLIILIVVVIIVIVVSSIAWMRKTQSKFTSAHPDAAALYFTGSGKAMLSSIAAVGDAVSITSVDGITVSSSVGAPGNDMNLSSMTSAIQDRKRAAEVFAVVGGSLRIVPGPHTLSLIATHARPGVLAKEVSTTYGPYDVQVNLQPRTSYQLSFDRNTQQFSIAERPDKQ